MLIRGMGAFQLPTPAIMQLQAGLGYVAPPAQPLPPPPGGLATALRMTGAQLAAASKGQDPNAAAAAVAAAAYAGTLAPLTPGSVASGTALAVAQLLPLSGAYDMPMPPPAPVPPPNVAGGGSLPATGPAVPATASVAFTIGGAVPPVYTGNTKGPNETALDAAMAAAGVTTDDQAATWLSSLDGQPAPQFLDETSSAYYLAILAKKQQEAKYLKWGIVGAGVLGLALLLK